MAKIDPLYLEIKKIENSNKILLPSDDSDSYLMTPGGKVFQSPNSSLIESVIYELHRFDMLDVDDGSIVGAPLKQVTLYSLLCSQLDFWDTDNELTSERILSGLKSDPLLYVGETLSEKSQLNKPYIKLISVVSAVLVESGYSKLDTEQSIYDEATLHKLSKSISNNFNNSESYQKSIFSNIKMATGSHLLAWVFLRSHIEPEEYAAICINYLPMNIDSRSEGDFEDERVNVRNELYLDYMLLCKTINTYKDLSQNPVRDRSVSNINDILDEIKNGESEKTEFKSTFQMNVRTGERDPKVETSSIKVIASFMNTKGGNLFIGISDDGTISGIDEELRRFHKSNDKYLLNFRNKFINRIGAHYYPFISHKIIKIKDKKVLFISCLPSDKEVWVDDQDFYVRTNPATDKLVGPQQIEYIRSRFHIK